jgi:hypothetical protein
VSFEAEETEEEEERRRRRINKKKRSYGWVGNQLLNLLFCLYFVLGFFPPRSSAIDSNRSLSVIYSFSFRI